MNSSLSTSFKALAIVALLSTGNGFAMDAAPAAPVTETVTAVVEAAKVVEAAAKPEAAKDCGCKFKAAISKAWTNASKTFTENKDSVVKAATDMKARGWTNWTRNEKAGIVIGATAVAAVAVWAGYKVYKAFTAPKAKSNVRNNRA